MKCLFSFILFFTIGPNALANNFPQCKGGKNTEKTEVASQLLAKVTGIDITSSIKDKNGVLHTTLLENIRPDCKKTQPSCQTRARLLLVDKGQNLHLRIVKIDKDKSFEIPFDFPAMLCQSDEGLNISVKTTGFPLASLIGLPDVATLSVTNLGGNQLHVSHVVARPDQKKMFDNSFTVESPSTHATADRKAIR